MEFQVHLIQHNKQLLKYKKEERRGYLLSLILKQKNIEFSQLFKQKKRPTISIILQ